MARIGHFSFDSPQGLSGIELLVLGIIGVVMAYVGNRLARRRGTPTVLRAIALGAVVVGSFTILYVLVLLVYRLLGI